MFTKVFMLLLLLLIAASRAALVTRSISRGKHSASLLPRNRPNNENDALTWPKSETGAAAAVEGFDNQHDSVHKKPTLSDTPGVSDIIYPTLTCPVGSTGISNVDNDVNNCCCWTDVENDLDYCACALSKLFWDTTWEEQNSQSWTPNFFARANEICSKTGRREESTLYYALPSRLAGDSHSKVARKVKLLMQSQPHGISETSLSGSVMTAGGVKFQGENVLALNWYLPKDFIQSGGEILPGGVCPVFSASDESNACHEIQLLEAMECYSCDWPEDYSNVTDSSHFFDLGVSDGFTPEDMQGNAFPLAFTEFGNDIQRDPWPLHVIAARRTSDENGSSWQWDENEIPLYILCRSPGFTEIPFSTSQQPPSYFSSPTTASPADEECRTPEMSIAFDVGVTVFNGTLSTKCPEGWWGGYELLECKPDGQVVWRKRCSTTAGLDSLFDFGATVDENLEAISDMLMGKQGNITGEELLVLVDTLDPLVDGFLQELQAVTDPDEAFTKSDNFTQGFLRIVDNLLDEKLVWGNYDPNEANATAASSKLLSNLERTGMILASKLPLSSPSASHTVDTKNVFMGVTKRTVEDVISQGDQSFYFPDEESDSYIVIPPGYHKLLPLEPKYFGNINFKGPLDVQTLGVLLKNSEEAVFPGRRNTLGATAKKKRVNSNILGFKFIVGGSEVSLVLDKDSEPVSIVFKHNSKVQDPEYKEIWRDLHPGEEPTAVPDTGICSFLHPENGSTWADEGCFLKTSSEGRSVCDCYHLTNFAVLMDVHGYVGKDAGLEVVGHLVGAMSIICLMITFLVFHFIAEAITLAAILTKHLSTTLLLGYLLTSVAFDKSYFFMSNTTCSIVAAVVHYLFLSAFCWMLLEGYLLYVRLVHVFQAEKKIPRWKYLTVGYVAPLLLVALTFGLSAGLGDGAGYGRGEYCWLRSPDYIWAFAGPVLLIVLTNIVFVVLALRSARKNLKENTSEVRRRSLLSLKGCMSLSSILGLGWLFGYFYVAHSPTFAYVFTLLNASQGVWIFVFHVLLNKPARTSFKRYLKRKSLSAGEWSSTAMHSSAAQQVFGIFDAPIFNRNKGRMKVTKETAASTKGGTSKQGVSNSSDVLDEIDLDTSVVPPVHG